VCDETTEVIELFSAQREFSAYGPSHLVVLAVFAIGAVLLVWIGRRQSESQARLLGRVLAVLMLTAFSVALVYKLIRPTLDGSVPLQLCDLAEITAAYALWSQRHWAFVLTYYWGLVLSSQALITPDVGAPDFPNHGFLTFFGLHLHAVAKPYSCQLSTLSALTANADGESSCRTPFRCRSRSPRPTNRSTAACAAA